MGSTDGLIVHQKGIIRVIQSCMNGNYETVELNNSGGNLGVCVNGELELLSITNRRSFYQQRGEPRAMFSAKAVENQEARKTCVLVSLCANSVQDSQ